MRHIRPLPIVAAILVLATGCAADRPSPPFSVPPPDAPSAPDPTTPPPAESPVPTAEPSPSDPLGPFTCDLPIRVEPTIRRANITDVRVGTHPGYDRVVFEFARGVPEVSLDRAVPPFTADASGLPIAVEGESILRLVMRGGTKQTDDGTSSYDGPTDFDPDSPVVVDLVEGGDFEAQSTWYIGLSSDACVRVALADNGLPRLVIDIQQGG